MVAVDVPVAALLGKLAASTCSCFGDHSLFPVVPGGPRQTELSAAATPSPYQLVKKMGGGGWRAPFQPRGQWLNDHLAGCYMWQRGYWAWRTSLQAGVGGSKSLHSPRLTKPCPPVQGLALRKSATRSTPRGPAADHHPRLGGYNRLCGTLRWIRRTMPIRSATRPRLAPAARIRTGFTPLRTPATSPINDLEPVGSERQHHLQTSWNKRRPRATGGSVRVYASYQSMTGVATLNLRLSSPRVIDPPPARCRDWVSPAAMADIQADGRRPFDNTMMAPNVLGCSWWTAGSGNTCTGSQSAARRTSAASTSAATSAGRPLQPRR